MGKREGVRNLNNRESGQAQIHVCPVRRRSASRAKGLCRFQLLVVSLVGVRQANTVADG